MWLVEKIEELHATYSPDFHLFRAMVHFLRGKTFNKIEEVITVEAFFASKSAECY